MVVVSSSKDRKFKVESSRRTELRKIRHDVQILCVAAFLAQIILGCSDNRVTLTKQPLTVEKVYLENVEDKSELPLTPGEEALTTWRFGCKADFDFDIVENTKLRKDDVLVTIRITKVNLTLTAPLIIWISKKASPSVLRHEMGHVEICRQVYAGVNEKAIEAGREVIGKEYQASAATVEAAVREAIERAAEAVNNRYHSACTDTINRVSTSFDELEEPKLGKGKETQPDHIEANVKAAFDKYKSQIGIKKK